MAKEDNPKIAAVKYLRSKISDCINDVDNITSVDGSRELSLVRTKLEEAKMWAGKEFGNLGRELPAEYRDDAPKAYTAPQPDETVDY